MTGETLDDARERLRAAGQEHLVAHAERLAEAAGASFLQAAAAHPWDELAAALALPRRKASPSLRPPITLTRRRQAAQGGLRRRLADIGQGFLVGGRVATVLLAGGQGTRLGHDGPKGTFVFGPEPDRTLYRILAERVAAAGRRAGRPVPFYVLVSPQTEAATRQAFESAATWGLDPESVHFVVQAELPCFDGEGRALLDGPGALARAPDGHGGVIEALWRGGVLDRLAEDGIDALTTFQVDNPLARPLDPVMLGWMVERRAQIVTKGVRRTGPDERVGLLVRDVRGRHRVVEYSELPDEGVSAELDLGSIAIHAFSVRWLLGLMEGGYRLPLHRALKKVPYWTPAGERIEPDAPNAWKLERFVFDVFPEAERVEVHEVERGREFAPVKNAEGVDSAHTARLLVQTEVLRWHAARGLPPPTPASLRPLEIDGAAPWE